MFKQIFNITRIKLGDRTNGVNRGNNLRTITEKLPPTKTLSSKLLSELELLKNFDVYYNKYKDYIDGFINNIMPYLNEEEYDSSFKMLQKTLESKKCPKGLNARLFIKYKLVKEEFKKREKNVYWKQGNKLPQFDAIICNYIDMMNRSEILDDENFGILCIYSIIKGNKLNVNEIYNKLLQYLKADSYRVGSNNYKDNLGNNELDKNSLEDFEKLLLKKESKISVSDIDIINGFEFEDFLGELFENMGFQVVPTRKTGDQGADLVLVKAGQRIAVQAKRYSSKVSNGAVQEIVASKQYYNCQKAMVVTNSYFTDSAVELANVNGVQLIDREKLNEWIRLYF